MDAVNSPHFLGSNMFLRGYDCKEVAGSHEEEECCGTVLVHWQVGNVVQSQLLKLVLSLTCIAS